MSHAPRSVLLAAVLSVGGLLLLVGCGGSDGETAADSAAAASTEDTGGTGGTEDTGETGETEGSEDAFQACLAEHGVELPEGGFPGGGVPGGGIPGGGIPGGGIPGGGGSIPSLPEGVDTQGFFEAFQECGDLAPSEAAGEGGQAFPAYLSCLGDHGVAVPEPASEGQAPSINRDDPAFEEANSICGVLLPDDDQTTTTTTTTTTTEG